MRYSLKSDWLFYLFLLSYAYLIINMTARLWFGDGVNIFASYSDAALPAQVIIDANKVYWSKTCFLFSILLLMGLNVDFRAAAGLGGVFWSSSLMIMFGFSQTLIGAFAMGLLLVALQLWRGQFFSDRALDSSAVSQELR
ncbi:hypothetical protein [Alterisphingorhabdus coralli]|uniref:Uncharacterized protein n=1 Tax=Alterisphingorhabdus coralli TaxID=3071408 RepID=A0AA97F7R7_9SPHN|nr:hypothetical protein [Parasphingorhabdus sp. SCSIO 66989]WOE75538.1 hypothetical protein RB602_02150 [Parasphingorhabdus sp. SCSIO 66989]